MKDNVKELLDSLTPVQQSAVYYAVKYQNNLVSIEEQENLINYVADAFAYGGDYDCYLSYWANIDNLIDTAIEDCNVTLLEN